MQSEYNKGLGLILNDSKVQQKDSTYSYIIDTGSGILINDEVFITASHAIRIKQLNFTRLHDRVQFCLSSKKENIVVSNIIYDDPSLDIVFLKLSKAIKNQIPSLLSRKLEIGDCISSAGYPKQIVQGDISSGLSINKRINYDQGRIVSIEKLNKSNNYYYITDNLMISGSSGCPGYDEHGIVFGMHIASKADTLTKERKPLSIWVSSESIIEKCKQLGIKINIA